MVRLKTHHGPHSPGVIGRAGTGPADGVEGTGTGNFSGVAGFGGESSGTGVFGVGGGQGGQGVQRHRRGLPQHCTQWPRGSLRQGGPFAYGVQGHSIGSAFSGVAGINGSNGAGISGTSESGYGGEFTGNFA